MDLSKLKEKLHSAKNICIVSHKNPDGDAIGSSIGLASLINTFNNCAKVLVPNEFPQFLNWIENSDEILIWDNNPSISENLLLNADVIFCLDFNALHRIGDLGDVVAKSKATKVMIDHHLSPEDFADYTLSVTTTSSTAELVFEFIEELDFTEKINKGSAEALYCGIMTDTGSFKFPSTSARTHQIISKLIQLGADNGKIHSLVYDSNSINRLQILGYCLDKMEVIENKISLFTLPKTIQNELNINRNQLKLNQHQVKTIQNQLKINRNQPKINQNQLKLTKGDTEGIVNYGLSIKEVIVSAFMREDDGSIKISFRSKGDFDVNIFARTYFSGGGHKNAAGGSSELNLNEAKAYFKKSILAYLNV